MAHIPGLDDVSGRRAAREVRPLQGMRLLLYALRIASLNLKGFAAERAEREGAASDKPQPAGDKTGNQKKERDPENEQSLTGLLLGFLAKPDDGSGEERPVIRTPEDYYALVDEERRRAGALPEHAPAEKNERRVS